MNLAGNPIDYLIVFGAGIVVSFSPCVYPLLPVTVGYVGGLAGGSRIKGFLISVVYALGVAITYSFLGAIASLTGNVFGAIAGSPWPYLVVANACILFGLVMLGVLRLPVLFYPTATIAPKGFLSVLVFGMVAGLAIGPCTAPVLGAILVYVGTRQNVVYAMSLLFFFAYGVCTTLILAGTFSSFLSSLPRAGAWLHRLEKAFGVVLIIMGEYFLIQAGRYMI